VAGAPTTVKYLVTGAKGFIGTHLVNELRDQGADVIAHDALGEWDPEEDLRHPDVVRYLFNLSKPLDGVIHLAAQVGRVKGEDDIAHTVSSNAQMTALIAHECAKYDVPLYYASTSEIYGDWGDEEVDETQRWRLPHNLYGLSKRWGEEVVRLYCPRKHVIWRPSMPYGPGAPPGRGRRAMDNFLWWAHHGKPITVHRGSERSWCWIGDTVRAMRMTIEAGGYVHGMAYNIGRDDEPLSMHALAVLCCSLTGADLSLIEEIDPPAAQTVVKRLRTEAIRELGWEPTVNLTDGLPLLYDWIKAFPYEENKIS
jgi:nucleoside-diphosphate-sugar epimerase